MTIHFGEGLCVDLPFMRVFKHSYPLLLLGADLLQPWRQGKGWRYAGLTSRKVGGKLQALLEFDRDGENREVRCIAFPGSITRLAQAGECL